MIVGVVVSECMGHIGETCSVEGERLAVIGLAELPAGSTADVGADARAPS